MKKLFFAIMMCIASVTANAQVLTAETVNDVYEKSVRETKGDFAYNAEWTENKITTMYIYKKRYSDNGELILRPHLKYDYSYAADGTLTSRVASRWTGCQDNWDCIARYDYNLSDDKYTIEYSRYNPVSGKFEQPFEMMVNILTPTNDINYISYYQRNIPTDTFDLDNELYVNIDTPVLYVKK
jgi:hypothetical protein